MKTLSISKDSLRAINYDCIGASMAGAEHPQIDMKKLSIHLLAAVPESIADCWVCLTNYQGAFPVDYINEIKLELHDWYWQHMCDIDIVE